MSLLLYISLFATYHFMLCGHFIPGKVESISTDPLIVSHDASQQFSVCFYLVFNEDNIDFCVVWSSDWCCLMQMETTRIFYVQITVPIKFK